MPSRRVAVELNTGTYYLHLRSSLCQKNPESLVVSIPNRNYTHHVLFSGGKSNKANRGGFPPNHVL